MKKQVTFLITLCLLLNIVCTACSNANNSSTGRPNMQNEQTAGGNDFAYTFTMLDPYYKSLLDQTMMTLREGDCAIQPDGALWSSLKNSYLGAFSSAYRAPTKLMDNVDSFSLSPLKLLAVDNDNRLWLWNRESINGPIREEGTCIADDISVALAQQYFCAAIDKNGDLWTWGSPLNAAVLGDGGNSRNGSEMSKVLDNVAAISASEINMLAIQHDGSLWSWGINSSNQVGDGTSEDRDRPVKIMDNVVTAFSGNYSMALCSDGSLWGWGRPGIIIPKMESSSTPKKIMDEVICFAAKEDVLSGAYLVLKTDGTLWGWGDNADGLIKGTGSEEESSIIGEPICIMDNIAYVAFVDDEHAMAVDNNNQVWIWGKDTYFINQENGWDDLKTPHCIDLNNLPSFENQPKWQILGTQSAWGIAGCPLTWGVIGNNGYYGDEYEIINESGDCILNIGVSWYIPAPEEIPDGYEPFTFNDGSVGIALRDESGHYVEWMNGITYMFYPYYSTAYDEQTILEIAKTLRSPLN